MRRVCSLVSNPLPLRDAAPHVKDSSPVCSPHACGAGADIFSLGCTYFFMLTGRDAFDFDDEEEDHGDLLDQIESGDVPFWKAVGMAPRPNLTDDAKSLITQMLVYDQAARPTVESVRCHPWLRARNRDSEPKETTAIFEQLQL
jgi:serine/threonine protein kinase